MHSLPVIRKANPSDIPSIRQIAFATWPDAYGKLLPKEQLEYMLEWMYTEKSLQEQMNKGHQFFMADLDGISFGFASVSEESDQRFKLNKLYVIPQTQKTGAGKALLDEVIGYAKQNKGTVVFLQVKRDNIAKGFYEKQGFVITQEVDIEIGNGFFMNDYIMELSI